MANVNDYYFNLTNLSESVSEEIYIISFYLINVWPDASSNCKRMSRCKPTVEPGPLTVANISVEYNDESGLLNVVLKIPQYFIDALLSECDDFKGTPLLSLTLLQSSQALSQGLLSDGYSTQTLRVTLKHQLD